MTERPTPQQIEGRLVAALASIRADWPRMLTPPSRRPGQRTTGTGVTLADTSDETDDTPRAVQVIDARREVALTLNGWCRVVIEDHSAHHDIPGGSDVPGMCEFLTRWSYLLAEHEAALDLLDEVTTAAATVTRWAPPSQHPPAGWAPRPRTHPLGDCPLLWQDPDTAEDRPCPGTLRGDEEGWVTCSGCGTQAVMGWWEQQLYGEKGLAPMTLEGVRDYLHQQHGIRLSRRGLQSWVDRGHLAASGSDGSTAMYDVGAVEAAVTRRQRTSRAVG